MATKVKIFRGYYMDSLEEKINAWLAEVDGKVDIEAVEQSAVTVRRKEMYANSFDANEVTIIFFYTDKGG